MRYALALLACVALLSAPLAHTARAADAKPDADGFVRDWLVAGPFAIGESSGADEIDKKQIEKEGDLKPKAGDKLKVGDKEQAWKAVQAKEYYLDLNAALGGANEDVLGYLVAYVVADKEMPDLTLAIGSNDQAKVFLNGTEVLKFAETRTIDKDSDKAEKLTLKQGVNVVVFKVINEKNNWEAALRFLDKAGKPVTTGLTVKTAP